MAEEVQTPRPHDPQGIHYVALVDIPDPDIARFPILLKCASGAEVTFSEIRGGLVMPPEDHADMGAAGSPTLVECDEHGQFIGLVRVLEKAPQSEHGPPPESYYVMLIPLPTVQHAQRLPLPSAFS